MRNAVALAVLAFAGWFVPMHPARAQSTEGAQETIGKFEQGDPGMQAWFREAYGYAVLPSVGKGGIGIGGARGRDWSTSAAR